MYQYSMVIVKRATIKFVKNGKTWIRQKNPALNAETLLDKHLEREWHVADLFQTLQRENQLIDMKYKMAIK